MKSNSKLAPFAAQIIQWFETDVPRATIKEACARLLALGCPVSEGWLSEWWSAQQLRRSQDNLLANIATGAKFNREMETMLGENPPAELETIIALMRVIISQIAVKANADPKLLKLCNELVFSQLEFAKITEKQQDRQLARDKFTFDAAKACLKELPSLKSIAADKSLDEDARIEAIRIKLFGSAPA